MITDREAQEASALIAWAIEQPAIMRFVAKSYATLDKRKRNGTYDRNAAISLLCGNVRDATRARGIDMSLTARDRAAKLLLYRWQTNATE